MKLLLSRLGPAVVFAWIGGCLVAAGTEYHVTKTGDDANPGTVTQPWATLAKAASVASAGDTVTIHAWLRRGISWFSCFAFRTAGKSVGCE